GFLAVLQPAAAVAVAGLIVIVILGLIGGLAAACFAKAFGIVFLGSPRSAEASEAREVARPMRASMAVLALLCIAIGLGAPLAVASLAGVVAGMTGATVGTVSAELAIVTRPLAVAVSVFAFLIAVAALAWALRAPPRGRFRAPGPGLGMRIPVPLAEDAIHGLVLRPAADHAIPPAHQKSRDARSAAGLFPGRFVLCQRQRRPGPAALVRADLPMVRPRGGPPQCHPARPHPRLHPLCGGDAHRA